MPYLVIRKQGQDFKKVNLAKKQKFIIGRDKKCDIVLDKVKGLSREHLKVYLNDQGTWVVELLSYMGLLIHEEENRAKVELDDGSIFSVPPYIFIFQLKDEKEKTMKEESEKIKPEHENKKEENNKNNKERKGTEDQKENFEYPLILKTEDDSKEEKSSSNLLNLNSDHQHQKDKSESALKKINQDNLKNKDNESDSDTVSDFSHSKPALKIKDGEHGLEEKKILDFKLKNEWILGRSQSCDIVVRDKKASRKHLKITFRDENYFIQDLNSINGTHYNGNKLKAKFEQILKSGDQLQIGRTKIEFENKIKSYSVRLKKIEKASQGQKDPYGLKNSKFFQKSLNEKNAIPLYGDESHLPGTVIRAQKSESHLVKKSNSVIDEMGNKPESEMGNKPGNQAKKKRFFQFMIFILLVMVGFLVLFQGSGNKKSKKIRKKSLSSMSNGVKDLEEESSNRTEELFLKARKYYMEGKYELCNFSVQKLHETVGSYKNSRELENLCLQAFELRKMEIEKEKLKKEKALAEQRVNEIINQCRAKLSKQTTVQEIEKCLFPAKEIDPMNTLISDLIFEVEVKEQKRKEVQGKKRKYKARVQAGIKKYEQAEALFKAGKIKKALKAYKKFIQSSYPDPHKNKEKAKRTFTSIIEEHNKKIESLLKSCKEPFENSNFKESFNNCKSISEMLPENKELESLKKKSLMELQKVTKGLFIDSVLHESVGNLELAIKKWKEIQKISVEEDDYYSRSKRKLKTYEGRL